MSRFQARQWLYDRWIRLSLIVLVLFATFLVIGWLTIRPRDPYFRGKRESEWIEQLAYRDDDQVKQWREFGPDGVRVLIRALEGADRPADRTYRSLYSSAVRILPDALTSRLPAPRMDVTRSVRMRVISLLGSLGNDAREATPIMAKALRDELDSARQLAICFFTAGEGADALINQMDSGAKLALLPDLIRCARDGSTGERNNAAIALGYFPEASETVAPVLIELLKGPDPKTRLLAAKSLHAVAPDSVVAAGVVPIVCEILKNPDSQISYRAADLLGQMKMEPSIVVPALIEALTAERKLLSTSAAIALSNYPDQSDLILPALLKTYRSSDRIISNWSAKAIKILDPAAAAAAGIK